MSTSHDHIWVYNRPRTMTNDEAGAGSAPCRRNDDKGQPINGLGFVARPTARSPIAAMPAPSVLEFDAAGKLLRAWGGPADPGWLGSHCKAADGCIWPNSEHGIYVDPQGQCLARGQCARQPGREAAPSIALDHQRGGRRRLCSEVRPERQFQDAHRRHAQRRPNSNDTNGGINGTPLLYQPADMVVDPKTNRLYVADGYGNRRVLIVDADTGKYIGHFGAYGNNPVDDAGGGRRRPLDGDHGRRANKKPAFFRNPVHCVKIADDGKIYVCDRGNDRIQVFDSNGSRIWASRAAIPTARRANAASSPSSSISGNTETIAAMPGTAVSMNFSTDKAQSCLYVGDNSNMTIYILNRSNLQELGRLGRMRAAMVGEFHWLHQVSLDSQGNIYTGEVDTGKRIQKFVRYGAAGCSGTGSATVGGPIQ